MSKTNRENNEWLAMKRRSFLKLAAGVAVGTASVPMLASCAPEEEQPQQDSNVPSGTGQPDYDKIVRTVCAPNCVGSCGINAFVKDDTIVKVEPAEFPDNAYHRICLRGISNAMQRVYSPDRVKYPMKRVGERGSGDFERISWEEAIDLIYEKMQYNIDTYGPTANSFLGMTGNYGVFPQIMASLLAMTYDGTAFTNFGIMGDNACNMGCKCLGGSDRFEGHNHVRLQLRGNKHAGNALHFRRAGSGKQARCRRSPLFPHGGKSRSVDTHSTWYRCGHGVGHDEPHRRK